MSACGPRGSRSILIQMSALAIDPSKETPPATNWPQSQRPNVRAALPSAMADAHPREVRDAPSRPDAAEAWHLGADVHPSTALSVRAARIGQLGPLVACLDWRKGMAPPKYLGASVRFCLMQRSPAMRWSSIPSLVLVLVSACRHHDGPTPPSASTTTPPPPVIDRRCDKDSDCAVAHIETSGKYVCCDACGTTPGTRKWHADLQRYCGKHPPGDCYPLACPAGRSIAVCDHGSCGITTNGSVTVQRRCLPAMVCDAWTGCTLARGNDQDGWFVEESARVPRGELAVPERVAVTGGKAAEGFRLLPPGVTCAPHSVPPILDSPPACTMKSSHCIEGS